MTRIRDIVLGSAIAFVILAVLGEVVVRAFGHTLVYERDDLLGWKPKADFSARMTVRDQGGGDYEVAYSTGRGGFRAFGDLSRPRKRVLFVGDSFTGDPFTSNEDAYFGIVRSRLPLEVFAVGGGGYGTLQELLIARRFVDLIKPDFVVLQYCTNDISDNSFELEARTSHVRNQKNLRPYLVGGKIAYRMPGYHPYRLLHDHSRLFRKLDIEMMKLQYRFDDPTLSSGAPDIVAERAAAIALTTNLMSQFVAAMPKSARVITISCSTSDREETQTWMSMSRAAGLEAHPSVSGMIESAERSGEVVRIHDRNHWNRLGHRIAGEELTRILARHDLLDAERPR